MRHFHPHLSSIRLRKHGKAEAAYHDDEASIAEALTPARFPDRHPSGWPTESAIAPAVAKTATDL